MDKTVFCLMKKLTIKASTTEHLIRYQSCWLLCGIFTPQIACVFQPCRPLRGKYLFGNECEEGWKVYSQKSLLEPFQFPLLVCSIMEKVDIVDSQVGGNFAHSGGTFET